MQRNPLHHSTFHSGATGCTLRLALSLEEVVLLDVRILHDDSEKRRAHRYPDSVSDVRRSELSVWDTSPSWWNFVVACALTSVAAGFLAVAATASTGL